VHVATAISATVCFQEILLGSRAWEKELLIFLVFVKKNALLHYLSGPVSHHPEGSSFRVPGCTPLLQGPEGDTPFFTRSRQAPQQASTGSFWREGLQPTCPETNLRPHGNAGVNGEILPSWKASLCDGPHAIKPALLSGPADASAVRRPHGKATFSR
jgi:hypothetical protein